MYNINTCILKYYYISCVFLSHGTSSRHTLDIHGRELEWEPFPSFSNFFWREERAVHVMRDIENGLKFHFHFYFFISTFLRLLHTVIGEER